MRLLACCFVSVLFTACGTSNTVQRVAPETRDTGGTSGASTGAAGQRDRGGSASTGGAGAGGNPSSGGTAPTTAGTAGFGGTAGAPVTHAGQAGSGTASAGAPGAGGSATPPGGAAGSPPATAGFPGTAGAGGASIGPGGAGATRPCSSASDCPQPSSECQVASCADGSCTLVDRVANAPCSLGVCTGTGICGECIPESGQCDESTPRRCGEDGQWVTSSECPPLSTCHVGACLRATLDWIWQPEGEGVQSAVDLAPTINGGLLVGSDFSGPTRITDLFDASPSGAVVIARLARQSGSADAIVEISPTGGMASLGALGSAPDGTFVLGAEVSGSLDGVDLGTGWGLARRVRSDLAGTNSTTRLWRGDLGTIYGGVEGVVATNTTSYVLASFEQEIWWATNSPPYEAAELEDGCRMFLAQLDHTGEPTWTAAYEWCTGIDRKVLRLSPDGDLYVGGPGGSPNHASAPVILGNTTITNDASAIVAKFDPATGNVARVRALPCEYGSGYRAGRVHDLAMLADGNVLAAVTCESSFAPDGLTLPDARGFLVRLDANLDVLQARPLGTVLDDNGWFDSLALAVGADETIYVTGTLASGGYDFGVGPHAHLGTCFRCGPGDAFVASYTSDLEPRWSLPIASPGQDVGAAIVRDADRIYVATQLGGPASVLGRDLVVEGSADAVVFAFTDFPHP
jgi:hypothetical protein